jgi:hypothetical protein
LTVVQGTLQKCTYIFRPDKAFCRYLRVDLTFVVRMNWTNCAKRFAHLTTTCKITPVLKEGRGSEWQSITCDRQSDMRDKQGANSVVEGKANEHAKKMDARRKRQPIYLSPSNLSCLSDISRSPTRVLCQLHLGDYPMKRLLLLLALLAFSSFDTVSYAQRVRIPCPTTLNDINGLPGYRMRECRSAPQPAEEHSLTRR